jgi:hypothetical protein
MLPYGLALVVSPPSLFINAGLSIPVLGVAEGFFTSTIYKGEGVLGLFLALLNVFILHALLLSHAYCCRAHCWVGGGWSFTCVGFLRWLMLEAPRGLLAMLRLVVLATEVMVSRKGSSLHDLVARVRLVVVVRLGQRVLTRLASTSDPRP